MADASAVQRLAELEGVRPLAGELLVAEVAGEIWAAVALESGALVADPYRPSGEVAELVQLRIKRLRRPQPRRRPRWLFGRRATASPRSCQ